MIRKPRVPVKEMSKEKKEERRLAARAYHLMRLYGITPEQYDSLLERQDHKCAVCQKHQNELKHTLHVDHNHKTGEIRGLLCNYCNHRVVGRHTDRDLVFRMYEYLGQETGWYVPKKFQSGSKKRKRKKT